MTPATRANVDWPVRHIPVKPRTQDALGMVGTETVDVAALERALAGALDCDVRFDTASLAMYAHDASNFRQVPLGVVIPRNLDDVVRCLQVCARFGAPVLSRGAGTSLSGEAVNYAVVIDHSRHLTAIGDVDVAARTVTVEAGAVNDHVNQRAGQHNLVFGPDPSTRSRCTIGGNVGNNSCGTHSVQSHLYGPGPRTSDNVCALEVCTYDGERFWVGVGEEEHLDEVVAAGGRKGEIYAQLRRLRDRHGDAIRSGYPDVAVLPRRVSGYNLDELLPERGFNVARALVGTEGTCVTVLRATLMLTPALLHRTLVVVAFDDICSAADQAGDIMAAFRPIGLEGFETAIVDDGAQVEGLERLPRRGAWLVAEFGADDAATSQADAAGFADWMGRRTGAGAVAVLRCRRDGGDAEALWAIREAGVGAASFPPGGDHWPGWEDSAVPPDQLGPYLRDLKALLGRHHLDGIFYGHLGHGCMHVRIDFDFRTAGGIARYRRFVEEAADLVVSYGGSLSGEHGDGQQRAELLERQYGPDLMAAMREFKAIWDPRWRMNPGKVVDAFALDQDLKLDRFEPPATPTKFAYRRDGGEFAHAAARCVGIGKCRTPDATDTICPSYQVTREEAHSTRGRARLLFEMLRGEVITDGWQSREVHDALDLCLACKGCTNDCPVQVDMPTYKAEFLYHHHKSWRRPRPRSAYPFGYIDVALRLAAWMPELANVVTHAPLLAATAKRAMAIDPRRPLPTIAPLTLQRWFRQRGGTANHDGPRVVLFPDTFTNHLHTRVGVAGVEALEAAGCQVVVPDGRLCCGRPLYDFGLLDAAERYLHRVVDRLRPYVGSGTPIVGMEPSCVAVFRDELTKLLPGDDAAVRLSEQSLHFGELFERLGLDVPHLEGSALLWGHCHQRATGGVAPDQHVLERMGLEVQTATGGCCGLAGSWGFGKGRYDISMDCGEQALLPAVRAAAPSTVVVANGFSCMTQVADAGTGRRALHLAEVMALARLPARRTGTERPEDLLPTQRPSPVLAHRMVRTGLPVAAGIAGISVLARRLGGDGRHQL